MIGIQRTIRITFSVPNHFLPHGQTLTQSKGGNVGIIDLRREILILAGGPLEHVGHMDGSEGREMPATAGCRLVVEGDRFENRKRHSPETEQVGTNFGVSRSEMFLLGLPDRLWFLPGPVSDGAVLLAQVYGQDEFPNIMQ